MRSYERFGKFKVEGKDLITGESNTVMIDSLWGKKISVYNEEDAFVTTGNCTLTVVTIDEEKGRGGNKVKLLGVVAYKR